MTIDRIPCQTAKPHNSAGRCAPHGHAAQANAWEAWLSQGEKNPHSAAHYGVHVVRPVSALGLFDPGVTPYTGAITLLEAHRQNPFEHRPAHDAPALARFGQLTAALVLQLFAPLLIVCFGFGAVAAERDAGTLRVLFASGVPRRAIALGKALGLGLGLGAILVPAACVGALALLFAEAAVPATPARVLVLAAGYLAYLAAVLAVTLAVSSWAPTGRAALVILFGAWIVNALVAPRAAADLVRAAAPLPDPSELQERIAQDLALGVDGHSPRDQRLAKLRDEVLARYGKETLEELPVNFAGIALQASEEHANAVFDRHLGAVSDEVRRQEVLTRRAGLIAPLLAVQSLSMALCGTDVHHHEDFARASEEHRRRMQRALNEHIAERSRYGERYLAGPELWAELPELRYEPPSLGAVVREERESFALLGLWVALAAVLYAAGIRRLRPT